MDFWTRLIGGGPRTVQAAGHKTNPEQRLDRFKRAHSSLTQACSGQRSLALRGPAVEHIHECLLRLNDLLAEEARASAPHLCFSYALSSQIYFLVARAALSSRDERLTVDANSIFNTLIDSEAESFVGTRSFARCLSRFAVRALEPSSKVLGAETESLVLEVLFAVTTKMRIDPEILAVWFQSSVRAADGDHGVSTKSFAGATQRDEFPLCYILIDRIHREGRVGDFARTGLLYIFDAASQASSLEEWILSSDLPTLMASGLGALYSQLSRELSLRQDVETLAPVLAFSDYSEMESIAHAENVMSAAHAADMTTFISHLQFWQDVLWHCKSQDIKQSLVDHFQVLFLQQLLYPSLLQSSDTDGGSSVAVLTYLADMLQALDHPELVFMILKYLLAIQDNKGIARDPDRPTRTPKRRPSVISLTAPKDEEQTLEPTVFNLVDLVRNSLTSNNAQTVFAALKLLSLLFVDYQEIMPTVLNLEQDRIDVPQRSFGSVLTESDKLLSLASSIGGDEGLEEGYEDVLQDVRDSLEGQVMEDKAQSDPHISNRVAPPNATLSSTDATMRALMSLLRSFLTNSVDVNLSLTDALISLAKCPSLRLDGWLTIDPSSYHESGAEKTPDGGSDVSVEPSDEIYVLDDTERKTLRALRDKRKSIPRSPEHQPCLPSTLLALEQQIKSLRKLYSNLDQMISKRKAILQGSEPPDSATSPNDTDPNHQSLNLRPPTAKSHQHSHSRNTSLTSTRSASPARPLTIRGRHASTPSGTFSPSSPSSTLSSPKKVPMSPTRLSTSFFRPPPPDSSPTSPLGSNIPDTGRFFPFAHLHESMLLRQKIRLQHYSPYALPVSDAEAAAAAAAAANDATGTTETTDDGEEHGRTAQTASLSHLLTNIVVLQNFVLELVAVIQLRAILFEEVQFV